MAIQNPNNLYTFGAVELNSQPTVNMYAQLMARKQAQEQAKQEAFDEYLRGLNTKLTPTGVRTQDMEAFNHMKDKWVRYGLENKEKLIKGDVQSQLEFNRLYQEALNIPTWSKEAEEGKKPMAEILTDPNKRSRLSSNAINAIASHDEPLWVKDEKTGEYVWNEKRKPIDYKSNLFDPQFDFTKAFGEWSKGMVMDEKRGNMISKDPVTGTVLFETTKEFTTEQLKQNAENAARSVRDNPEYNNYYQFRWEKLNEDELKKATESFQSVYGKEITLPSGKKIPNLVDSPEKLAAAEAIAQGKSMSQKGTKEILDRQLANQRAQVNITLNKGFGGGDGQGVTGNEFDRINLKLPNENYSGEWVIDGHDIPKQTRAILKAGGIDITQKDSFNNSVLPKFRLKVENGTLKEIWSVDGKELIADRTDMENAQKKWNSEPQKSDQPGFGGRNDQQKPNQVVTYKYNGHDYTEQEIIDAAKADGISKEEYIKRLGIKRN